jgi:hypothetical protein
MPLPTTSSLRGPSCPRSTSPPTKASPAHEFLPWREQLRKSIGPIRLSIGMVRTDDGFQRRGAAATPSCLIVDKSVQQFLDVPISTKMKAI